MHKRASLAQQPTTMPMYENCVLVGDNLARPNNWRGQSLRCNATRLSIGWAENKLHRFGYTQLIYEIVRSFLERNVKLKRQPTRISTLEWR